jgi:cephalosporin-C deacetylase-like acetyl esterase
MPRLAAGLAALLALTSLAHAQDDLTVLKPAPGEPSPRKMLYAYLEAQAKGHFDARRKAVAALKTPEDVQKRQQELRAKFLGALGDLPEKTPLKARVVGKEDRDGYRVEKVIYESRPDHHVTAALYLPEGKPPFPGVLFPCGHSVNGKAAEAYQRACILLAKNGLAVLCYDPIGQGERVQLLNDQGKAAISGSTTEHSLVGVGALLVGRSAASYRIWDGIRSLDYLASRPEIDTARLGCTGNSGGGTMTAYLMALDDRIAVAAPSCYITTLERLIATIGPQDAEQNITGQIAFGLDHADYAALRAPKPTLLCVGTRDYFDIDGAWASYREAKLLFGRLGHGERVDLFESDEPHGFTQPRREAAMRWMRRWLLSRDDAPTEGSFPIATDAQLQCTSTGQVLSDLHGRSAFDLNAERAKELDAARAGRRPRNPRDAAWLDEIRRRIALRAPESPKPPVALGEVRRDGYTVRKLALSPEPGIMLPALLVVPDKAAEASELEVVVGADRRELFSAGGPVETHARAGHSTLILELRGLGETSPEAPSAKAPGPLGTDSKEAFLSILLDRPLLGQRVFDVLASLDILADQARHGVHLVGLRTGGPIALHAAALDPRITRVTIQESVISWSAVAKTALTRDQLTNAVPGALALYDLPDLAAAIAPRPLAIRTAVDPAGKAVAQKVLDEAYASCREAYRGGKAEDRLTLQAEH